MTIVAMNTDLGSSLTPGSTGAPSVLKNLPKRDNKTEKETQKKLEEIVKMLDGSAKDEAASADKEDAMLQVGELKRISAALPAGVLGAFGSAKNTSISNTSNGGDPELNREESIRKLVLQREESNRKLDKISKILSTPADALMVRNDSVDIDLEDDEEEECEQAPLGELEKLSSIMAEALQNKRESEGPKKLQDTVKTKKPVQRQPAQEFDASDVDIDLEDSSDDDSIDTEAEELISSSRHSVSPAARRPREHERKDLVDKDGEEDLDPSSRHGERNRKQRSPRRSNGDKESGKRKDKQRKKRAPRRQDSDSSGTSPDIQVSGSDRRKERKKRAEKNRRRNLSPRRAVSDSTDEEQLAGARRPVRDRALPRSLSAPRLDTEEEKGKADRQRVRRTGSSSPKREMERYREKEDLKEEVEPKQRLSEGRARRQKGTTKEDDLKPSLHGTRRRVDKSRGGRGRYSTGRVELGQMQLQQAVQQSEAEAEANELEEQVVEKEEEPTTNNDKKTKGGETKESAVTAAILAPVKLTGFAFGAAKAVSQAAGTTAFSVASTAGNTAFSVASTAGNTAFSVASTAGNTAFSVASTAGNAAFDVGNIAISAASTAGNATLDIATTAASTAVTTTAQTANYALSVGTGSAPQPSSGKSALAA